MGPLREFPRLAPEPFASAGRAPPLLEHQDQHLKQRGTRPASLSERCCASNFPLRTVPCGKGSCSPPPCPEVQERLSVPDHLHRPGAREFLPEATVWPLLPPCCPQTSPQTRRPSSDRISMNQRNRKFDSCRRHPWRPSAPQLNCQQRTDARRGPAAPSELSTRWNKPPHRCCSQEPRYSMSMLEVSARSNGASARVLADCGERTCQ